MQLQDTYTLEVCPFCATRLQWLERTPEPQHTFGWVCPHHGDQSPLMIRVQPTEAEVAQHNHEITAPPLPPPVPQQPAPIQIGPDQQGIHTEFTGQR